jgi:hypothetical protein
MMKFRGLFERLAVVASSELTSLYAQPLPLGSPLSRTRVEVLVVGTNLAGLADPLGGLVSLIVSSEEQGFDGFQINTKRDR